jgi:hypothetical protein
MPGKRQELRSRDAAIDLSAHPRPEALRCFQLYQSQSGDGLFFSIGQQVVRADLFIHGSIQTVGVHGQAVATLNMKHAVWGLSRLLQ